MAPTKLTLIKNDQSVIFNGKAVSGQVRAIEPKKPDEI